MSSNTSSSLLRGVAFVTGGARGLGNAVASSFARAGCSGVAIIDVLPEADMEAARRGITELGAEVSPHDLAESSNIDHATSA